MSSDYYKYLQQKRALYNRLNLTLPDTLRNIPRKRTTVKLPDIDHTSLINKELNIDSIRSNFNNKRRVVISNIFEQHFASLFNKTIRKIPLMSWNIVCGVNNTKYENKITGENKKSNADNAAKARRTFGEDKFAYVFYRTMCDKKVHFLPEKTMRDLLMSPYFVDLIYKMTGIHVTQLNQMFLSRYKSGHFLAPHSDVNNGKIAFVINFSAGWKPQYGGVLHFLSEDRRDIIDSYVPKFNSMMIFEVPEKGIPHFVSHIAPNVRHTRYALTGWYS
jgi:Rps23 Pro-64 3,4-dihydroxylase Tpa1-like proline 4-hydroxylase